MSWIILIYFTLNTIILFLFDWVLRNQDTKDKVDLRTEIILNAINSNKETFLKVAIAIIFFGLPLFIGAIASNSKKK